MRTPKRCLKEQQITQAKVAGFELGLRAGSTIAAKLIEAGWKDLDILQDEVVSRVTGRRRIRALGMGRMPR
jgi:hypothetical protein